MSFRIDTTRPFSEDNSLYILIPNNSTNQTDFSVEDTNGKARSPLLGVVYVVPVVFIVTFLFLLLRRYYKRLWKRQVSLPSSYTTQSPQPTILSYHYESTSECLPPLNERIRQQGVQVILPFDVSSSSLRKTPSLAACSEKATSAPPVEHKISVNTQRELQVMVKQEGTTVKRGCYTLKFPPGCLDEDTQITVTVLPFEGTTDKDYFRLAPVLRCEPSGLSFNKPFEVILESSFFAWKSDKLVTARVSVRQDDSLPWVEESSSLLGHDGKLAFSANHFSERAVDCSLEQRGDVGKDMCTFGFQKFLDDKARDITWYVMDKSDSPDYERICGRHAKEEEAIPYESIKVKLDRQLKLTLTSSRDVQLNPNEDCIENWDLLSANTRPKKFLVELTDNVSPRRSTVSYTIRERVLSPRTLDYENTNKKVVNGRFFIQWVLPRSESTTNVNINGSNCVNIGNEGPTIISGQTQGGVQPQELRDSLIQVDIRGLPAARTQTFSSPNGSCTSTLARSDVSFAAMSPQNDVVFFP